MATLQVPRRVPVPKHATGELAVISDLRRHLEKHGVLLERPGEMHALLEMQARDRDAALTDRTTAGCRRRLVAVALHPREITDR